MIFCYGERSLKMCYDIEERYVPLLQILLYTSIICLILTFIMAVNRKPIYRYLGVTGLIFMIMYIIIGSKVIVPETGRKAYH